MENENLPSLTMFVTIPILEYRELIEKAALWDYQQEALLRLMVEAGNDVSE